MKRIVSIATGACLLASFCSLAFTAQPPQRQSRRIGAETRSTTRPARSTQPAKWLMDPVSGENLHYKTFQSDAAGQEVSYLIYIPAEYETSGDKRYPVVYWLHGIGGSQQGIPRLVSRLDEAVQTGKAPAMLMVFVNGMRDSLYVDSVDGKTPVESMIINDLIPHIDATYRTIATREGRMIEGFSMGGFGAGHLGFKYPELFGSVSIIDGALLDLSAIKSRHAELFERIFGGQDENFTQAHPRELARKNAEAIRGRTVIRQAVGALVSHNESLRDVLQEENIEADYDVFEDARHSHPNIYEALGDRNWEFYSRAFEQATSPGEEGMPATQPME